MKSFWKKAAAALLAGALCFNLAGCYDENMTWAAKKGDDTMPIGGYIYYLNNAYSEAVTKVGSDTEVLKGTIDGKDAETWIRDTAMQDLNSYYFIAGKCDELKLEITQEEKEAASSNAEYMKSLLANYSGDSSPSLDDLGVATESLAKVAYLYNTMYQKVMLAMYSEGGEMEIPEDELKVYFTENYYNFEYFTASLTKSDDNGQSVGMTDDEKSEIKKELEEAVKKINDGKQTVQEAAEAYAEAHLGSAENSTFQAASPTTSVSVSDIEDVVKNGEDNSVSLVEGETAYYVVHKLAIADSFESTLESESSKTSLISNMKGDDFADYVEEQAASVEGVELNQAAMDRVKLTKFVTDSNKNGTSSTASKTESSEAESSSAESSETESSGTESSEAESSGAESSEASSESEAE